MSEQRRRSELSQRLMDEYPTLPTAVVLAAVTEAERAITLFGDSAKNNLDQVIRHNLTAVLRVFDSAGRTGETSALRRC